MGAASFIPALLRLMPGAWKALTAVAHTLPYDATLLHGYQEGRPLPDGHLVQRRGLGHTKKLNAAATLTDFLADFLTGTADTVPAGDRHA